MDINDKILSELIAIRKLLAILTQDKLDEFNENVKTKYLTSEPRKKMYDLFDGTNSLKIIAEETNTTSEAVRQFAVSLEKAGLVEFVSEGKTKNPKRIF